MNEFEHLLSIPPQLCFLRRPDSSPVIFCPNCLCVCITPQFLNGLKYFHWFLLKDKYRSFFGRVGDGWCVPYFGSDNTTDISLHRFVEVPNDISHDTLMIFFISHGCDQKWCEPKLSNLRRESCENHISERQRKISRIMKDQEKLKS